MNALDLPVEESKKKSLVTRSLKIWAVIILISIGSMAVSLYIVQSAKGDAARINVSGSLRMQSYRISQQMLLSYYQIQ